MAQLAIWTRAKHRVGLERPHDLAPRDGQISLGSLQYLRLNRCHNVELMACAFDETDGTADLHVVVGTETGGNSLRPPDVAQPTRAVSVPARRLDDVLKSSGISRVDFIKIDVFGPDIAAGVRRIKAMNGPDLILWGSSTLTPVLIEHCLADEVMLLIYPVLLGTGKRFFSDGTPPRELALVNTKAGSSGVIMSTYRPSGPLRTGTMGD